MSSEDSGSDDPEIVDAGDFWMLMFFAAGALSGIQAKAEQIRKTTAARTDCAALLVSKSKAALILSLM